MTSTSTVNRSAAKGGALRRPWICAWIVTVAMGGTTMAFQVYHSITRGHMPWPLAVLYGIVPLLIAVLVLEIVAEWARGPFAAKVAAYVIMGAAMFLSASATGAVVLQAAPPHFSLLFGALLDAAELLAAYFIMNGPLAADAVAETASAAAAGREARLRAEAQAQRSAREEAVRIAAEAEAALRAQIDETQAAMEAAATEAQAALRAAALRAEAGAQTARDTALEAAGETLQARENALLAQIDAERRAREIAEQGAARWTEAEDKRIAAEIGREASAGELRATREALEAAIAARKDAETAAAQAEAKAATLTRKLDASAGANGTRKPRKSGAAAGTDAGRKTPETQVPNDVDAQAEALSILADEPDIAGAKLGPRVGKSERWGQLFLQRLAARPAGGDMPDAGDDRQA